MGDLIIKRKSDWMDTMFPYRCYVNGKLYKVGVNTPKRITLDQSINFFEVKHFWYYKSNKIVIPGQYNTTVTIKSPINVYFLILVAVSLVYVLLSWKFDVLDIDWLRDFCLYGIGTTFFGLVAYFVTFGYHQYIDMRITYEKTVEDH